MSQAFTRILDNQSNKLLANFPLNEPKMDVNIPVPVVQPVPLQIQSPQVQLGEGIMECKGIKLFGFEFTVYSLILVIVLTVCVGYFMYKYFFTKTDIVVYKKNPKKELKKNKSKNKEEFSDDSDVSNMSNSSTAQTLDM
jgi:hypothetical protein